MGFRRLAVATLAVLLLSPPVFADSVGPTSDELRITNAAGAVLFDGQLTEGGEAAGDNRLFTTIVVPTFTMSNAQVDLEFVESGVSPRTASDVLTVVVFAGVPTESIIFDFHSDVDGVSNALTGTTFVTETGTLQDVTNLLPLGDSGLTVQVFSDVESVPEPPSLMLLASALSALIGARRWCRRRRYSRTATERNTESRSRPCISSLY